MSIYVRPYLRRQARTRSWRPSLSELFLIKTWIARTSPAMASEHENTQRAEISRIQPLEDQRGVGAAEAEGVRQDRADLGVVDALAHDRHVGEHRIKFRDMGALADEAVIHHQQRVDRLLHAGGAERMAGQRLGRGDRRTFLAGAEHLTDCL